MATFYGNLKGSRGEATRCGTAASGITASVRSWNGSVTVSLDEADGRATLTVNLAEGSKTGGRVLFCGSLSEFASYFNGDALRHREALERISRHEARADRRHRGMTDASEVDDLQRIADLALAPRS